MNCFNTIKDKLITVVKEQMECLEKVDAKEMGEVIDMIKDLEQCIYYQTVIQAMTGNEYGFIDSDECDMYQSDYFKHLDQLASKGLKQAYMDTKRTNIAHSEKIARLNAFVEAFKTDMNKMIENTTEQERQILRGALNEYASTIPG